METINTMLGTPSEMTIDFDHMDALFCDGSWSETADHRSNSWQRNLPSSTPSSFSLSYLPSPGTSLGFNPSSYQVSFEDETQISKSYDYPPLDYPPSEKLGEVTESGKRYWIGPNPSSNTTVKKRLMQAIEYLKETTRDREVLIQIWQPEVRGGKYVLTTYDQPYVVNSNCKNLADYRVVSSRYQFAAEEDSEEFTGLPGRVFLKKLPECTPDVRFFKVDEYARVNFAQQFNVSGSLAIPVFEHASRTCLGVIEIVTTAQQVNYGSELDTICKALEAVDLRSSKFLVPPSTKNCNESYRGALAEIREVLQAVCDTHNLPLAQTWAPCTQQGEADCQQSDGYDASCVSIVESACYVFDPKVLAFHEACREHHLLRGEGVAGGAFLTNQPCFATDITAFSKTEYPLSHHARIFRLRGAVAIRLRSLYTGSADFVLEFFLPLDCKGDEEQTQMLSSLSAVIEQVCRNLRVVTEEELEEETSFVMKGMASRFGDSQQYTQDESSWISHMMEAQMEGTGVSISLGCHKEEPEEEFKFMSAWSTFPEGEQNFQKDMGPKKEDQEDLSSIGEIRSLGTRKAGERRRVKTERNISLQVLQQYFPGSLKDAAKSIGVCPTTLKRICRQHGITRWPSRKIKKVGHSLRKLQLVIDSVQGTDGAIQLSSFYTNFPELSSPALPNTKGFSMSKLNDPPQGSILSPGTHSPSPSNSSGSSLCNSTGDKEQSVSVSGIGTQNALSTGKPGEMLKRECGDAELHELSQEETKLLVRSQSHNFASDHSSPDGLPALPKSGCQVLRDGSAFRVKASFGEEKIRLSLPLTWGFQQLQKEVVTRFKLDDLSNISLKYLDDDSEWVLLTCDADLEECIDIHRSSGNQTIKLLLHLACQPDLGSSFNKSDLS